MQVPTSALFREGADWAVFVVAGGQVRKRRLEPGHRGSLRTEILTGLSPDDVVVIHPGAAIRDGVRVTFR